MPLDTTDMKAGDEIDAWCNKCKDMKLHKIRALVPGKDPKVVCLVCDSEHNYRAQPSTVAPAATARPRAKRVKAEEHNPWQELVAKVAEDKIKPYGVSLEFYQDDFIQHHRYGLGVVTEILDTSKMVVAFEDKKRIMVYNK